MELRVCKKCGNEKPLSGFVATKKAGKPVYYNRTCRTCENVAKEQYRIDNRELLNQKAREVYSTKKDLISKKRKTKEYKEKRNIYYKKNAEKLKNKVMIYQSKNRDKINARERNRINTSPEQKLADRMRSYLKTTLRRALVAKNMSSLSLFTYSMFELKQHLESLFEPWMSWNNWGLYNAKTWDDNDSSTWTWQIDHIIPCASLPFDSLEHPNFHQCWSLENLRPYSAKLNCIDGVTRIRHISKNGAK